MTELSLRVPSEAEVADALEGIEEILRLDEIGEIDLAPYLTGLLLQLEEILAETPITPRHPAASDGSATAATDAEAAPAG